MASRSWRAALTATASLLLLGFVWRGSPPDSGMCYSAGEYTGAQWVKPNQTLHYRTVVETPWARVQLHTVRSESGDRTFTDWLWVDERDHINVLAQLSSSGKFPLWRQSKYGLAGTSLAPTGGFINEGESPLEAAVRELNEELGLRSDSWHPLGAYRTAVNRGGGTLHSFLALDAVPVAPGTRQVSDDAERQDKVELSQEELLEAVLAGAFVEVKWTATVALSLLRLPSSRDRQGT
eukprot:COSAG04_NODE_382_length_15412_cov_4.959992_7_plen_236_part_00